MPALAELETTRGEALDSLLIRPVQRLCKYPLFFGELLRILPEAPAAIVGAGGLRQELEAAIFNENLGVQELELAHSSKLSSKCLSSVTWRREVEPFEL